MLSNLKQEFGINYFVVDIDRKLNGTKEVYNNKYYKILEIKEVVL